MRRMRLLQTDISLTRDSYYEASVQRPAALPALQGTERADVGIVGGGLAGLSAALELARAGRRVVLLEASRLGGGASGRNGGQAIHGLACDQTVIEQQLGIEASRQVWQMSLAAIDLIRQRIRSHHIDAEWQDGFLGLATSERKARSLRSWAEGMHSRYGFEPRWIDRHAMPDWIASERFHGGIHDPHSGHLHPLKYTLGVARAALQCGAALYEHSPVVRWTQAAGPGSGKTVLHTARGELHCDQVLLAGNASLSHWAPQIGSTLAARIMPVGTYIVCTAPMAPDRLRALIPSLSAVCDTNFVLDYFRPTADHRLLYGGRVSYSTVTPVSLMKSMQQRLLATFPQLQDVPMQHAWGGFVDITMNRAPDFGRLADHPQVYYLQGFSGHGLALTGMAGCLVAEAMMGDASRFDVFAKLRHRSFPGGTLLRMPALVLGMAYYRLRDML